MTRTYARMPVAALLAALLLAAPLTRAGDMADARSLEKQIEYLRDAMGEAIRTRDWHMLELAAKGFKASGLTGDKLEMELLRAERDVALYDRSGMYMGRAGTIAWGLSCRAMIYGGAALAELRALANSNPVQVKPPDAATFQANPESAQAALKAYGDYTVLVDDRNRAIFCLAMMKEPGIDKRALECLMQPATPSPGLAMMMGGTGTSRDLISALLGADPKNGWKLACGLLSKEDADYSFDQKLSLLLGLSSVKAGSYLGAMKFTIDGEIAAALPEIAREDLVAPYVALVKAYQPKKSATMDYSCNSLVNLGIAMTKTEHAEDVINALEELKGKIIGPQAQYVLPMLNHAISRLQQAKNDTTTDARPVKPAKAPDDF